jgi:hypothetical protein
MDQREYIFLVLYQTLFICCSCFDIFLFKSYFICCSKNIRNHVLPLSFHFDVGCLRVR